MRGVFLSTPMPTHQPSHGPAFVSNRPLTPFAQHHSTCRLLLVWLVRSALVPECPYNEHSRIEEMLPNVVHVRRYPSQTWRDEWARPRHTCLPFFRRRCQRLLHTWQHSNLTPQHVPRGLYIYIFIIHAHCGGWKEWKLNLSDEGMLPPSCLTCFPPSTPPTTILSPLLVSSLFRRASSYALSGRAEEVFEGGLLLRSSHEPVSLALNSRLIDAGPCGFTIILAGQRSFFTN